MHARVRVVMYMKSEYLNYPNILIRILIEFLSGFTKLFGLTRFIGLLFYATNNYF